MDQIAHVCTTFDLLVHTKPGCVRGDDRKISLRQLAR